MNGVLLFFSKWVGIGLLLLGSFTSVVYGAQGAAAATPVKADVAKGEALFTVGDIARNVIACVTCHGVGGNATIAINPKLAGQHEAYLIRQLRYFKSGERTDPAMSAMAAPLTEEDILNVSAFLEKQIPQSGAARNASKVALGKRIYRGGIAAKDVPACAACHGASGSGIPVQYPRLAGQNQEYTVSQLTNFRNGKRHDSAPMATISERLSDAEIEALADYIAGLK